MKILALIFSTFIASAQADLLGVPQIMNQVMVRETVGSTYRVIVDFSGPDVTLNEQQALALSATLPGSRIEQERFFWIKAINVKLGYYPGAPVFNYCYRIGESPNQSPLSAVDQSLFDFWNAWSGTVGVMSPTDTAWCMQ